VRTTPVNASNCSAVTPGRHRSPSSPITRGSATSTTPMVEGMDSSATRWMLSSQMRRKRAGPPRTLTSAAKTPRPRMLPITATGMKASRFATE